MRRKQVQIVALPAPVDLLFFVYLLTPKLPFTINFFLLTLKHLCTHTESTADVHSFLLTQSLQ